MGKRRKTWKRAILRSLDLPEEADGETVRVTMLGRDSLLVENHGGVLQFSAQAVRLFDGDGVLRVYEVQIPGKKRMETSAFLRGYTMEPGTVLTRE